VTLVVVSGPAGAGKTTLAHALGGAIGCPVVCRDEIKEGMVGPTNEAASSVFFEVVGLLARRGVTTVAEAAFQDHVWRPNLEPLLLAGVDVRVAQCHADAHVLWRRRVERGSRAAHDDEPLLDEAGARAYADAFVRVALDVPSIDIDTTDGYRPALDEVAAFVRG
jgi:predicted kinase